MPQPCPGCGESLAANNSQSLCWRCLKSLPVTKFEQHQDNPVATLFFGRMQLHHASAMLFFNAGALAQQLVHQIKYKGHKDLGQFMGEAMAQNMLQTAWANEVDVLVPLPLNAKKQRKRGFNQSMLLCEGMAKVLQKPIENVAVVRTAYTDSQTRKTRQQRWSNVAEVFDLMAPERLQNRHVLLVDDVVTTGATLEACGQQLLKVPGVTLSVNCLAMASKI